MDDEMFPALRPLWWSSLAFGAAPLGLLPFRVAGLLWSLGYLLFFSIYCSMEATSIRLKDIPKFVREGDFTTATITFVGLIFTVLSSTACCSVLMHIFQSGKRFTELQANFAIICEALGISLELRLKRHVRQFLAVFWPYVVYWSIKEVGVYYDVKEFYVTIFECLSVLNRLTLMHIEEQFKTFVLMQKWIFQDINLQLEELMAIPLKSSQKVHKLEILRKNHHKICELGTEICTMFQSSLVLAIVMINLDVMQGGYYSSINAINSLGARSIEGFSKGFKVFVVVDCLCWGLINFGRFFLIVSACSGSNREAKKTRSIAQVLEQMNENEDLKDEILRFSIQLQHIDSTTYSVFGMYTLDFATLGSVISTVLSYVAILLQFHNLQLS